MQSTGKKQPGELKQEQDRNLRLSWGKIPMKKQSSYLYMTAMKLNHIYETKRRLHTDAH